MSDHDCAPFPEEGAVVESCDIRPGEGHASVDLTDEDAVLAWLDGLGERHRRIDVLYVNAGATRFSPVADLAPGLASG